MKQLESTSPFQMLGWCSHHSDMGHRLIPSVFPLYAIFDHKWTFQWSKRRVYSILYDNPFALLPGKPVQGPYFPLLRVFNLGRLNPLTISSGQMFLNICKRPVLWMRIYLFSLAASKWIISLFFQETLHNCCRAGYPLGHRFSTALMEKKQTQYLISIACE